MYKFALFMIPLALIAASDKAPADKDPKKTSAAARSGSVSIPANAEEIGPQVYRYKDADGKSWIYRKTPFGISKMEEGKTLSPPVEAPASPAPSPANSKIKVTAVDKGDSVRFEQQTPMGPRIWERKKSELTPQESAWLEQTKSATAPEK